jgi:glycosyltransferase involved in cell wall biosynthesis
MSKPLKTILFLSPRPNLGGASQVLLNLLHASQTERSFRAVFLFEESGHSLDEYRQHGTVFVFPLEKSTWVRKILRRLSRPLYDYFKYRYARRVISSHRIDGLYINSLTQNPSIRAALASSLPLILHAHEMDFLVTFKIPDVWVANMLSRASVVVACSQAVADFYERTYDLSTNKISVIHGPVSSQRLAPVTEVPQLHSVRNQVVVGVVASFSYLKAPDTLIEALYILQKKHPDLPLPEVRWLGVSASPYFHSIQNLVKKRELEDCITFLPASPDTASFYTGIDIFVLPSRIEAFPLSILEAMLFEKPVVAMDVGGVREVVDAETGYLVRDRTPEGLAEGIMYFMQNETQRVEAGRKGRKRVLENYEAQVQAKKWLKLLENV